MRFSLDFSLLFDFSSVNSCLLILLYETKRQPIQPKSRCEESLRLSATLFEGTTNERRHEAPLAQPSLVRAPGQNGILLPLFSQEQRVPPGPVRRPSCYRYLQHVVRTHPLQRPFSHARRTCEVRRTRRRRISP